jgi:integrase
MARPATGSVVETKTKHGRTFAIRYRAQGQRWFETVGTSAEGMTRKRAEQYLQDTLSDVRRNRWQPPIDPTPQAPQEEQTFDDLAGEWLELYNTKRRPAARTLEHAEWALGHLRKYFGPMQLSEINARAVDAYIVAKTSEGVIGANQLNKTLARLATVLDLAVRNEQLPGNPARGSDSRVKGTTPARPHVEVEQLMTLLESAPSYDGKGRAIIAVLAGGGVRVSELLGARRGDVNLAARRLYVRASKTQAGIRPVDLSFGVRDELLRYLEDHPGDDADFLFGTRTGRMDSRNNIRRRVIVPAMQNANPKLAELGIAPIGKLAPHGLRRTFANLREACGDSPSYTAKQLGHTDSRFTLRVYAESGEHREQLSEMAREQYDAALDWARMGSSDPEAAELASELATEKPV